MAGSYELLDAERPPSPHSDSGSDSIEMDTLDEIAVTPAPHIGRTPYIHSSHIVEDEDSEEESDDERTSARHKKKQKDKKKKQKEKLRKKEENLRQMMLMASEMQKNSSGQTFAGMPLWMFGILLSIVVGLLAVLVARTQK